MARHRSRVNVPPATQVYTVSYSKGGTSFTEGPYVTAHDSESMTDEVTPNYHQARSAGTLSVNSMGYQRVSRSSSGMGQSNYQKISGGVVTVAFTGSGPMTAQAIFKGNIVPVPDHGIDGASLRRDAILAALAGIDKTPLSTGEDLAELGKTIAFLKAPLAGILDALKRGKARGSGTVAASWLTYRFAVTPLVRSIHDILGEISRPTKKPPRIRTSHGRREFSSRKSARRTTSGGYPVTTAVSQDYSGTIHAAIRYSHNVSGGFAWRYGLRAKDILPTFWAVMPYSFMVDRIADVSSMIMAAQNLASPSISILDSSLTIKTSKTTVSQVVSLSSTTPGETYSGQGEVVTDLVFHMSRTRFDPGLSDIIPVFKPSGLVSDLTKIADLLALIRQAMKR